MSDKMMEARKVLDSEVYDRNNATVSEVEREAVMKQLREQQSRPVTAGAASVDAVRQTIADEWGSHVCWRDPVTADRICTLDKCRCADIAKAVISQHALATPPAPAGREEIARIIDPQGWENYEKSASFHVGEGWKFSRMVAASLAKADAILALGPAVTPQQSRPVSAGREEDHPDCTTDRERELYDALMGLASHATANYPNYRKWSQGGLVLAPVVARALRLEGSELTPQDGLAGLDERLDRLLLTADDGGRFVLSTESAKNIVGIVREWLRPTLPRAERVAK